MVIKSKKDITTIKFNGGGDCKCHRIRYLDALKGFAIICVVMGHLAVGYTDMNTFPSAHAFLFVVQNVIYAFHMPLFMMLSGSVYSVAYTGGDGKIARDRVRWQAGNLILIYLIWSLLTGISRILLGSFVNKTVTFADLLLIPVKAISPYWYLYTLICFYFIISSKCWARFGKWEVLTACAVACFIGNFIGIDWVCLKDNLYYLMFFYIGTTYRSNKGWILGNRKLLLFAFPSAVLLSIVFWDTNGEATISSIPLVRVWVALGFSLAICYAFERVSFLKENKLLSFVGRYSLEIYLSHHFVTAASRLLPRFGVANVHWAMSVALGAAITCPILFSVLCKKMGIHGLFFKPLTYFKSKVIPSADDQQ